MTLSSFVHQLLALADLLHCWLSAALTLSQRTTYSRADGTVRAGTRFVHTVRIWREGRKCLLSAGSLCITVNVVYLHRVAYSFVSDVLVRDSFWCVDERQSIHGAEEFQLKTSRSSEHICSQQLELDGTLCWLFSSVLSACLRIDFGNCLFVLSSIIYAGHLILRSHRWMVPCLDFCRC